MLVLALCKPRSYLNQQNASISMTLKNADFGAGRKNSKVNYYHASNNVRICRGERADRECDRRRCGQHRN